MIKCLTEHTGTIFSFFRFLIMGFNLVVLRTNLCGFEVSWPLPYFLKRIFFFSALPWSRLRFIPRPEYIYIFMGVV